MNNIKIPKKLRLKKKTIIILSVVAVVIAGLVFMALRPKPVSYDTAVAARADITQEVSVTGKVKAAENVSLAFQGSGRIASIRVAAGSKVSAGDLLMSLDNSDLAASLAQAEASLRSEEARLSELRAGSRPEEVSIQETKVAAAKASSDEARSALSDAIEDAYAKADDALRNKADSLFISARTNDPQLHFRLDDTKLDKAIRNDRVALEGIMTKWNSDISAASATSDILILSDESDKSIEFLKSFLDELSLAVNGLTLNSGFPQTIIDGWKASVSAARAAIGLTKSSLSAAKDGYRADSSSLTLAEQQLSLMLAGATADQIAAEEAKVDGAKASVSAIRAQISKGEIRSPITGVVSKQDAKIGEIVGGSSPLVSVISDKKFQIEANIPEADIAKVTIGNDARITLDAYGSDVPFSARLISVNPGETVIEGVTTYKAVFEFSSDDSRIKSGMTANLDVVTDKKEGVIAIPQRAVGTENGKKVVRVLDAEKTVKTREVKTGIRGIGGLVEIIEGLSEGETVVTSAVK